MTNGTGNDRPAGRWQRHRRVAFATGLALVATAGAVLLLAIFSPGGPRSEGADRSLGAPTASAPASAHSLARTPPAWAAKCLMPGGTPLPQFLGLTYSHAQALAKTDGDTLLLMGQAGSPHGTCSGRVAEGIPSPVDIVLGADHRVVAAECEFHPGTRCGSE
jgi:hypothetical protein